MPFIPRAARLSGQYDVGSYRRLIILHDGLRVEGLADDANRRRMAGRLAPGSPSRWLWPDLVAAVWSATRIHGALAVLNGRAPTPQEFNELAHAAPADSLVARRFALDAERFVRGDHSGAAALKATLASRNNHDRFAAVATGEPRVRGRAADFR